MIAVLQLRPYANEGDVVLSSPNHGVRRAPVIEGIVLHATADGGDEAGTLTWLQSPKSGVSCHLLIGRSGCVTRLVGDQQRAWHAGQAFWRGTSDVNSITIGIEIANRNDGEPFTDAEYCRAAEIVAHYCRQGLTIEDVVGHGDIAEGRRTDPLGWDWERFRRMVQDLLRPPDLEQPYDRRSSERVAAAEAGVDIPPPPPQAMVPAPPAAEGKRLELPVGPVVQDEPIRRPSRPRPPINAAMRTPAVVARSKPVLASRTVWANGLTVLAAGSVLIADTVDLATSVGMSVPEWLAMWALFAIGLVNILLRFETTCPVGSTHCAGRGRSS
jgi:N-acetylmuramoyl-L-alanine amidase